MNGLAAACFAFRRSGWEAAVGGGIPCIKALKEGLAANNITYAAGIMNGAQHCPWHLGTNPWHLFLACSPAKLKRWSLRYVQLHPDDDEGRPRVGHEP